MTEPTPDIPVAKHRRPWWLRALRFVCISLVVLAILAGAGYWGLFIYIRTPSWAKPRPHADVIHGVTVEDPVPLAGGWG